MIPKSFALELLIALLTLIKAMEIFALEVPASWENARQAAQMTLDALLQDYFVLEMLLIPAVKEETDVWIG